MIPKRFTTISKSIAALSSYEYVYDWGLPLVRLVGAASCRPTPTTEAISPLIRKASTAMSMRRTTR